MSRNRKCLLPIVSEGQDSRRDSAVLFCPRVSLKLQLGWCQASSQTRGGPASKFILTPAFGLQVFMDLVSTQLLYKEREGEKDGRHGRVLNPCSLCQSHCLWLTLKVTGLSKMRGNQGDWWDPVRLPQRLPTIPIFKTRDLFREVTAFLFTTKMSSLSKRDTVSIVVHMRIFAQWEAITAYP